MKFILAIPKGRISHELIPLMRNMELKPEDSFFDDNARQLRFKTSYEDLDIIKVRSFDVVTFVTHGAAHIGIAGSDVLTEWENADVYAPIDLGIGKCRLSLATLENQVHDYKTMGHIKIATKYPRTSRQFFLSHGIQVESVNLGGAMEIAPSLGLAPYIVDLVSSGKTLKENNLVEVTKISDVSSRLIVNRTAYKTQFDSINKWIEAFKKVIPHATNIT